jgi:hypothetical protein
MFWDLQTWTSDLYVDIFWFGVIHSSVGIRSEGQETGAIAPASENARKKIEGRGRSCP